MNDEQVADIAAHAVNEYLHTDSATADVFATEVRAQLEALCGTAIKLALDEEKFGVTHRASKSDRY